MRFLLISTICVGLLMCAAIPADAQLNRKAIKKNNRKMSSFKGRKEWFAKVKRYNAIGFSVNALNYYGDLAPKPTALSTDISFTRPGGALSFMHRFGPRYSIMGSFMYGSLRGADAESANFEDLENGKYRYQRNLSFRNNIKELSVMAYFDLFDNDATYMSRPKWTPYAYIGIAGFMHNPQAIAPENDLQGNPLPQAGQWVDLRPLGTEGQNSQLLETDANYGLKPYSKIQAAIPIGIGARFRLTDVMDLWVDVGFRYTFTDYLDDVSGNYVDLGVLDTPLAKAMSYRSNELPADKLPPLLSYQGRDLATYQVINGYGSEFPSNVRGSKNDRDIYMVTSIKLTYILGKTFHRAKFR
ncbi:MAG: DUF6089 family protein [Cyclobacteriaceae bacterium]|nr:DUF6089 family protein [Cyclobacteriaceae bacterium]